MTIASVLLLKPGAVKRINDETHAFKYYDLLAMASVASWMVAVMIAQKIVNVGSFVVSLSVIVFPITYLLSDIMTEVYGYARTRRVTWLTVIGLTAMFAFFSLCISTPSANEWQHQEAFDAILDFSPRIISATLIALFVCEMTHAFFMSQMKVWMGGEKLWMRTVSSAFIAQGLGAAIFFILGFGGVLSFDTIMLAVLSIWFMKTIYEALMTPVTYFVINKLKRAEEVDLFDVDVDYSYWAFSLKTNGGTAPLKHQASDGRDAENLISIRAADHSIDMQREAVNRQ